MANDTTPTKIRIPGTEIDAAAPAVPEVLQSVFSIRSVKSFEISTARACGADTPVIESLPDDVVEVELEDGSRFWTTQERLRTEIFSQVGSRGAEGEVQLPATLDRRSVARGLVGRIVIKTLKFFQVDIAEKAARFIAGKLEDHLLGKTEEGRGPGLYRLLPGDALKLAPVSEAMAPLPADRPSLLFLHGTASSTAGSFGKLWTGRREPQRQQLLAPYDGRVFALEHESLTEDPITNAIAAAQRFPVGARLHLVSHSRGGLVGELLCRTGFEGGRAPFDAADLRYFAAHNPDKDRGDLERLNTLLIEKRFRIERFVRVACPARGTNLASERLDIYLSVLFNLLSRAAFPIRVPGVGFFLDLFSELIMAVAKERSDPAVLPGIEAMIPSSPLVGLLNRTKDPVAGELRVIAGDIEGDDVLSTIGTLLADPLYQDDHDLVVNTDAMFGGAERSGGAGFLFRRGADVNHFSYFENADSADGLARTLSRSGSEADGFEPYSVLTADSGNPPYEKRGEKDTLPVVFLLPGIMGTHLTLNESRIWLDPFHIAEGKFRLLSFGMPNLVKPEAPFWTLYGNLARHLAKAHRVEPFPFDWRLSFFAEGNRLAEAVAKALDDTAQSRQPVSIVAHSSGGLVARAMIAAHPEIWTRMKERPGTRLIMLGTPNGGTHMATRLLTGRDSLIRKLALLDTTSTQCELLSIMACFPGLLELLPTTSSLDLFEEAVWSNLAAADTDRETWQPPTADALATAKANRDKLAASPVDPERMFYLAGWAPATPVDLSIHEVGEKKELVFLATSQGDGLVPWSTGIPEGVKSWYFQAAHGDLPAAEEGFDAISDLLRHGDTDRLPTTPPETRGVPERSELPMERAPLYPDFSDLARAAMGSGRTKKKRHAERKIQVSVRHGSLAFAGHPVLVGHYKGDTIISAEAYLDRTLDGRLSARHRVRLYPGDDDTAAVFLNEAWEQSQKSDGKPPGAIVIGLGEVGKLTPGRLLRAVSRGVRSYILSRAESFPEKSGSATPAGISALLVGTGAGGIAVQDAVNAILRGIIDANRFFEGQGRITEVEIVEVYEDRAIQAARTLARLRNDPEIFRACTIDAEPHVLPLEGGMRRADFGDDGPWWQRLQITEDKEERLSFNLLTDRARAEVYLQQSQRHLADRFIEEMAGSTSRNEGVAVTLFEMLFPNELKEYAPEHRDMVLVLNETAARYPWEMMQERRRSDDTAQAEKPLAVQAGLVRQLLVEKFRDRVVAAREKRALVVGNPHTPFADLPGAEKEAQAVVKALKEAGYDATPLIGADATGTSILTELFARDYQVVHLAGHGVFEYRPPVPCDSCRQPTDDNPVTGMVIGESQFLTAAEIRQMRTVPQLVFVNCCHLGNISDRQPPRNQPPNLAANVAAELIRMGVRGVVAAGWAVQDDAAALFAATFYREMFSGSPFGDAVLEARKATYSSFGEYNTWGAYQCYGDPDFCLIEGGAAPTVRSRRIFYTARSEAIVALDNITAEAKSTREPAIGGKLRDLREIEQGLPPEWLIFGDLQAALGRAYSELKQFEEAIGHYRKAIAGDTGLGTIKTVEQLCNLEVRWAAERAAADPDAAQELIGAAEKRLQGLIDCLGDTAERHALLGSAAKRRILITTETVEIRESFTALKKYYRRAYELGKPLFYPLVNHLTAQALSFLTRETGDLPSDFTDLLDEALELAAEEHRVRPDFWNTVTTVDCLVLKHLAAGDLPEHTTHIIDDYRNAGNVGSPRELHSVLDQLAFLQKVIAAAPENELRLQLVETLETIRQGVEKGDTGEKAPPRKAHRPPLSGTTLDFQEELAPPAVAPSPEEGLPERGIEPSAPAPELTPKMSETFSEKEEELQPVELGISAPRQVKPGAEFTARFVAYEKDLEKEVLKLLKKLSPMAESVLGIQECRWKHGTPVTVTLSVHGLTVDPPEQTFTWEGGRSILGFTVAVSEDTEEGFIPLNFHVVIAGIIVARLQLDVEITPTPKKKGMTTATGNPARTAFASYSSKDALRVLDRVNSIKISAGIDVFQDCLDLHPGEEWKPRLDYEIRHRDAFLLFWSNNASKSPWVLWELDTALQEKKELEQYLQVHPLEAGVDPPPGLEKVHVGSVEMLVRKGMEAIQAEKKAAGPT